MGASLRMSDLFVATTTHSTIEQVQMLQQTGQHQQTSRLLAQHAEEFLAAGHLRQVEAFLSASGSPCYAPITTRCPVSALWIAPKTIARLLMLSVQAVSGAPPVCRLRTKSRITPPCPPTRASAGAVGPPTAARQKDVGALGHGLLLI